MPTQLTFCRRCNAPVYAEPEASGGCACADGQLLGLLASMKQESVKTASAAPAADLPPLSPEMWMSESTLREVRFAQGTKAATRPVPQAAPSKPIGRTASTADITFDDPFDFSESSTPDPGDLGSLWISNLQREGIETTGIDFEFSTADDIDTGTSVHMGADRFRADRAPPPRPPRAYNRINDGEYVRPLYSVDDSAQMPMGIAEVRAAARGQTPPTPTRTIAPRPPGPPPSIDRSPAVYVPTVFERLVKGGGPLDD
jgi:hypothetical protein